MHDLLNVGDLSRFVSRASVAWECPIRISSITLRNGVPMRLSEISRIHQVARCSLHLTSPQARIQFQPDPRSITYLGVLFEWQGNSLNTSVCFLRSPHNHVAGLTLTSVLRWPHDRRSRSMLKGWQQKHAAQQSEMGRRPIGQPSHDAYLGERTGRGR
jgi:hypothetical protein